jgi:hypothetical protein
MKNKPVLFLALSFLLMFTRVFGSSLNDESAACWQKGVHAASLAKDYVPGKIYMIFERLDGDGISKGKNELWFELLPGEKEAKLIKALEDGKDVTGEELEKERIRREKNKEKGKKKNEGQFINLSSEEIVPLLSNAKKPVAYKYLGREKKNGVECHAYEFQKDHIQNKGAKQETVKHQGKIWLDAVSGMPVAASYTQTPLPSMVKQMEMQTAFISAGDKFFIKNHEMYIKAGFLFIKKRFRIRFVLDGFRKSDEDNQGHA